MTPPHHLTRELGVFGATMMGLGSIIGTGIFVSIAIAAEVAGPAVLVAIALAAAVAVCNALSSGQLAANHPTSGGTYEYGYVYLTPSLGFAAGWLFLCAKSASAAAAALGFAGYVLVLIDITSPAVRTALALAAVIAIVLVVLGGMRRSSAVNIVIVCVTLIALAFFVLAGAPKAIESGAENLRPFFGAVADNARSPLLRLLEASALMFVAYTGYGRIATMGEEVRAPRRTIPRAIVLTLVISMALYLLVGTVGIAAVGAEGFGARGTQSGAPLAIAAESFGVPGAGVILSIGAVTAMLGVLLNLVLGLSRVMLAMSRRGDMPHFLSHITAGGRTPAAAVLMTGLLILAITSIGSIRLAWSFSAFTVLIYYAITNLAALRLPAEKRLYHPAIAWLGLAGCLSLAFLVDTRAWLAGVGLLAAGLLMRLVLRSVTR